MKIAIIDIGSNNVRIVIYRVRNEKQYVLYNIKHSIRLINHLEDGTLTKKGYNHLKKTLLEYKNTLIDQEVDASYLFATAVLRYATNKDTILSQLKQDTDFDINLLSWQDEARYGCNSVIKYLPNIKEAVSVDLGGGSTEIVYYKNNQMIKMDSLKFGSVFLKSNFVNKDLPNKRELKAIKEYINFELSKLNWLKKLKIPIVLIGGNARNLAKIDRDIINSEQSLNGYLLTRKKAEILMELLMQYSKQEIANIRDFTEERADIIIPSILVFISIAKYVNTNEMIISRYGLREGVLTELLSNLL